MKIIMLKYYFSINIFFINTEIILDEVEALKEAIKESNVGDSIIVFYEKIKPLIEVIDKLNDNKNNTDIIKSI